MLTKQVPLTAQVYPEVHPQVLQFCTSEPLWQNKGNVEEHCPYKVPSMQALPEQVPSGWHTPLPEQPQELQFDTSTPF